LIFLVLFALNELRCAKLGCVSRVGFPGGEWMPGIVGAKTGEKSGFVGGGAVIKEKDKGKGGNGQKAEAAKTQSKMKGDGDDPPRSSKASAVKGAAKADPQKVPDHGGEKNVEDENVQAAEKEEGKNADPYSGAESDHEEPVKTVVVTVEPIQTPSASLSDSTTLKRKLRISRRRTLPGRHLRLKRLHCRHPFLMLPHRLCRVPRPQAGLRKGCPRTKTTSPGTHEETILVWTICHCSNRRQQIKTSNGLRVMARRIRCGYGSQTGMQEEK
jgi:hypothetical protein